MVVSFHFGVRHCPVSRFVYAFRISSSEVGPVLIVFVAEDRADTPIGRHYSAD